MARAAFRVYAATLVAMVSVSGLATGQESAKVRRVEVFLNGQYLLTAHAHVRSGTARTEVDQGCVEYREIARLLGGPQFLSQRGRDLHAERLGAGRGATLRVLRLGRISSRVHQSGDELYIPLLDFARALRAIIGPSYSDDRIDLTLDRSTVGGLLAPNDSERPR
jgi:hypothetical protein